MSAPRSPRRSRPSALAATAGLLALIALIGAARGAAAFSLLSPERTWESTFLVFVDSRGHASVTDGDGGTTAVVKAIDSSQTWRGAGAGILAVAVPGLLPGGLQLGDGRSQIVFDDPLGICTDHCLAATIETFFVQRADGSWRITDSDVVSNPTFSWTTLAEDPGGVGCDSEVYLDAVMVHEMGHVLGLGHSTVPGATMRPVIGPCDFTWTSIEADDRDAILALWKPAPCTDCLRFHGALTGPGGVEIEPNGVPFFDPFPMFHSGWLVPPSGANFDLFLERLDHGVWKTVGSSTEAGSATEHVRQLGPPGFYRWRAQAVEGSGIYRFYWGP